jgi:hypothetical protein
MKWQLSPLISKHPYDAPARRGHAQVQLLFTDKKGREDKENMQRSLAVQSGLKSYKSVQQLKPIAVERTLEKRESLRVLTDQENKPIGDFKKGKKRI